MGRKSVPTNLKVIKGTLQKCRENKDEPTPEICCPEPPDYLDGEALEEWHRKVVELYNNGCMTRLDDSALAAHCVAWARHVKAEKEIKEGGEVITTSFGNLVQNPWVGISNKSVEVMYKYATILGLGAANRSKIKAGQKPGKEKSKWAKK